MNRMIVPTLMAENQNSISPNSLTPMRLMARAVTRAMAAQPPCGRASLSGLQKMRKLAMTVESAMSVNAQLVKWNQPAAYAPFSPMNSRL